MKSQNKIIIDAKVTDRFAPIICLIVCTPMMIISIIGMYVPSIIICSIGFLYAILSLPLRFYDVITVDNFETITLKAFLKREKTVRISDITCYAIKNNHFVITYELYTKDQACISIPTMHRNASVIGKMIDEKQWQLKE